MTHVSSTENTVNDHLARTPELYLLALTQSGISADTESVLINPYPTQVQPGGHMTRCAHPHLELAHQAGGSETELLKD